MPGRGSLASRPRHVSQAATDGSLLVFITGGLFDPWRRLGPGRHDVAMVDGAENPQFEGGTTAAEVPAPLAEPTEPPSSIAESLLAQATSALALAVALIYAAGGLALGLKLWFLRVPWTTVLGQLPQDPLIITAVGQVVVPCLAAGAVLGALIDWLDRK